MKKPLALFFFFGIAITTFSSAEGMSIPPMETRIGVGYGELFGKATLQCNGKCLLTIPIAFVGAGTFSKTNVQEVVKWSRPRLAPNPAWFGTGKTTFTDIPILYRRIQLLIKNIEATLSNQFISVKINPTFVDEKTILNKDDLEERNYSAYIGALYSAINDLYRERSPKNTALVYIVAIPNPDVATPTIWDMVSDPILFAHELCHMLGIRTEGYGLADYPANGIMNDELDFLTLRKRMPSAKITMLESDFCEMARARLPRAIPAIPTSMIDSFCPATADNNKYYASGYPDFWGVYRNNHALAIQWSEQKVSNYINGPK